jgi:hypothetical protein
MRKGPVLVAAGKRVKTIGSFELWKRDASRVGSGFSSTKRSKRLHGSCAIFGLLLAVEGGRVAAQPTPEVLSCDEAVHRAIGIAEQHFFRFTGSAGERVVFNLTRDFSANFGPVAKLLGPDLDLENPVCEFTAPAFLAPCTLPVGGDYTLVVQDDNGMEAGRYHLTLVCSYSHGQLPGDCNQDAILDISDAVCVFRTLFAGDPVRFPCGDGTSGDPGNKSLLDWNQDGMAVNVSDGIDLLQYYFRGGPPHRLAAVGAEYWGCIPMPGCSDACGAK